MRIFVYGTLKRGHGNNRLLQGQKFIGTARTYKPYVMTRRGCPFVYEVGSCMVGDRLHIGKPIEGEVWEIDEDAKVKIDQLEGHPRWYRRKPIPILLDGDCQDVYQAWLYFMPIEKYNVSDDPNHFGLLQFPPLTQIITNYV